MCSDVLVDLSLFYFIELCCGNLIYLFLSPLLFEFIFNFVFSNRIVITEYESFFRINFGWDLICILFLVLVATVWFLFQLQINTTSNLSLFHYFGYFLYTILLVLLFYFFLLNTISIKILKFHLENLVFVLYLFVHLIQCC